MLTRARLLQRCVLTMHGRALTFACRHRLATAVSCKTLHRSVDLLCRSTLKRHHSHRSSGGPGSRIQVSECDFPSFVQQLSSAQRRALIDELTRVEDVRDSTNPQRCGPTSAAAGPTASQLLYVAAVSGVPFIAFGLLDNTIMICAGEYIDITFGTVLGLSTMAAAGLGNMCSDIVGISTANFVEHGLRRLGFKPPGLSVEMLQRRGVRWSANAGRVVGVSIGCLLGLFPLLFIEKDGSNVQSPTIPAKAT